MIVVRLVWKPKIINCMSKKFQWWLWLRRATPPTTSMTLAHIKLFIKHVNLISAFASLRNAAYGSPFIRAVVATFYKYSHLYGIQALAEIVSKTYLFIVLLTNYHMFPCWEFQTLDLFHPGIVIINNAKPGNQLSKDMNTKFWLYHESWDLCGQWTELATL